jgi:poly(3-hydroxybutyrate) depolymerase
MCSSKPVQHRAALAALRVLPHLGLLQVLPALFLNSHRTGAAADNGMQEFPGPAAVPSRGCGKQLPFPVNAPLDLNVAVADPILFNKYREYYLALPPGYNNTTPLPLVLSFHGFYDEAIDMQKTDKLMYMARTYSPFIVVHPQGLMDTGTHQPQKPYPQRTWNCGGTVGSPGPLGPTCDTNNRTSTWGVYPCYLTCQNPLHGGCKDTCSSSTCANDTLFVETLLDELEDKLCIDKRRIHSTGISNGGMMAYQTAVDFSPRLASVFPVAGSALLGFWTPPSTPVALMDIHGRLDDTIPANASNGYQYPNYAAPHGGTFSDDGMYYTNNTAILKSVAKVNNCTFGTPVHWPTSYDGKGDWYCNQPFGTCGRYPVVRCTWNGKHRLPLRGRKLNLNVTHQDKVYAFGRIAYEWMQHRYLGSP